MSSMTTVTRTTRLAILTAVLASGPAVEASIVRIVIDTVESPTDDGRVFGDMGPYERLIGRAFGELDPDDPRNALIQDLDLAPRNERGRVDYVVDFVLRKPVDLAHSSGILRYDAPNRGNAFAVDPYFQHRGHILLAAGWQGDVPEGTSGLRVEVPVASHPDGSAVTGIVRAELITRRATQTLPLSGGAFSGGHVPYAAASLDQPTATLTARRRASDPAELVPRARWRFADCGDASFPGRPLPTHVCLDGGFDPALIYELTYTARDPLVLGIGFAATRDLVSFFRHDAVDGAGTQNPIGGVVRHTIGAGTSQSGNFVKTLIHLGFNEDESGRPVFDGLVPLIAARHTALNVRFGQPGRGGGQREDHVYPGHAAPSTWAPSYDAVADRTGGMLVRCRASLTCPKVVQPLSTAEYWHLQASPTHTDAKGLEDIVLPPEVRVYLFASTQHSPRGGAGGCVYPLNPAPYADTLRALTVALEAWVVEGVEPPDSRVPRVHDGTLVAPSRLAWPAIPGVTYTGLVNPMPLLDFGPGYRHADESGIVREPPVRPGRDYGVLVPQVDQDGNDLAGIRSTAIQAPVGTYTGWNYLDSGDACILSGAFFPFATTRAERERAGDPRSSLEERYGDQAGYVAAVRAASAALVAERLLLPEDADRLVAEAEVAPLFP